MCVKTYVIVIISNPIKTFIGIPNIKTFISGIVFDKTPSTTSAIKTAAIIGADTLGYLPVSQLSLLTGTCDYCSACFNGDYPTEIPTDTCKNRFEQKLSEAKKER